MPVMCFEDFLNIKSDMEFIYIYVFKYVIKKA